MEDKHGTALVPQTEEGQGGAWLTTDDIRREFSCGVSKAQLIVRALPHYRVGNRNYVLRSDLMAHLQQNGGITGLEWPKRKRR